MLFKLCLKKSNEITLSFLLLLIILSGFYICSCSRQRPVIDLNSDLKSSGTIEPEEKTAGTGNESSDSILTVAIGAMISPEVTIDYYYSLLELVAEKMDCRLEVSQRRTYAEVNELVAGQKVDFAFVCSGAYITGKEDFNMELLAVPVSHGESVYYSYIIVNKNSGISSFSELKGKTFVFTDPDSNTGCMVPRYMLTLLNETPETYFGKIYFTYSHDNSIKAVAEGLADGAAVDSLIWEYLKREGADYAEATRIVRKSQPFGIPPVVVNPMIDNDKKEQLKKIFLHLHEDSRAVSILHAIQIDRFEEGQDSMYDGIREMLVWIAGVNRTEPDG